MQKMSFFKNNLGHGAGFSIEMEIYFYAFGELEISRYLTYRAQRENVPMTLTDSFFVQMYELPTPILFLFGIQMGDEETGFGDVICDEFYPQYLIDFKQFELQLYGLTD